MKERYTDQFLDMIQDDRLRYETFKDNISTVPDAFQESVSREMDLDQLTEMINNLDQPDYSVEQAEVEITADTYDSLGIIESDRRTLSGTKLYRAPNYNGRGASTSWNEIVTELSEAALEAEKQMMRIEKRERADQTEIRDFR